MGARVESVIIESGRAAGVRLANGTVHRAASVVMAVGPREAAELVEGQEELPLREWAENAVPVRAASLDVVLKGLPQPQNAVVFDVERPLFLTVQSQFSNLGTGGDRGNGALAHALKYLDPFAVQDPVADKQELEHWLDQTQPGWREKVVESRFLPHLVVSNAMVDASRGGQAGRPGPEVPGVTDLYVAGDWVGPVGQLAAASLWSAREAALAITASPALARAA